ncbi:MAG: ABC transporter ATP-binding protein [Tepidanaerobacteraceae bacterium]|nr:ABC transporter ATP-binding protein [Tepidanaerobacteraceae bacterium]
MLKIDNLHAAYGGIKALRGVSIEVKPGECVAVLGANGAGKSTLLKIISAVMKPVSGSITFCDRKIPSFPYLVVQCGIVHVPEGRQIFPNLTVYENLMVGAFLRNDKNGINQDLEWVYTLFPRLKERQHQYGGLLSGGEQQMLAISRGLMAHPKLLLLDEPSLGLAPIIVNQIFEILKEINKSGTAILIVEQNAYKALSVADRGYIMATGVIEKSGTSKELLSDEKLLKAYLGD